MIIPNKIKIGGYEFDVIIVEKDYFKNQGKDEEYTMALMDYEKLCIKIATGFPKKILFSSFIHEVLEAYKRIYRMKISHNTLEMYEGMVIQFLVDNFDFNKKIEELDITSSSKENKDT